MATRLLPRTLQELYAHALILEREATKRFSELERYMRDAGMDHVADEFGQIGKEEREQYELLAVGTAGGRLPDLTSWEYAWHYMGAAADEIHAPRNPREALTMAIRSERRAQVVGDGVRKRLQLLVTGVEFDDPLGQRLVQSADLLLRPFAFGDVTDDAAVEGVLPCCPGGY